MRASEFILKLADLVDAAEKLSDQKNNPKEEIDDNKEEQTTMIPPLQQKIELLKKVANVDSFYDDPNEERTPSEELKRMQMNAGIIPSTIADDEVTE